jgi:hypothetical protein
MVWNSNARDFHFIMEQLYFTENIVIRIKSNPQVHLSLNECYHSAFDSLPLGLLQSFNINKIKFRITK